MSEDDRVAYELIPDRSIMRFLFQFKNAEHFYVSGRIALLTSLTGSAILLSHQALELYLKSVIMQFDKRPDNHHNLIKHVKKCRHEWPYAEESLGDKRKVSFMGQLTDSYLKVRYGEAGYNLTTDLFLSLLDDLVFNFRRTFLEIAKVSRAKLYVPSNLQAAFLDRNEHFKQADVSDHIMASMMITDYEPPQLEAV